MAMKLGKLFGSEKAKPAEADDLGPPTTQIKMGQSQAGYDPLASVSIMDQLRTAQASMMTAPRKLWLIGNLPVVNYGSAALTDPSKWVLTQIRERPQTAINTYDVAQIDGEWANLGIFKLSGGGAYKEYKFTTTELRRSNGTSTNLEPTIPTAMAAIAQ